MSWDGRLGGMGHRRLDWQISVQLGEWKSLGMRTGRCNSASNTLLRFTKLRVSRLVSRSSKMISKGVGRLGSPTICTSSIGSNAF